MIRVVHPGAGSRGLKGTGSRIRIKTLRIQKIVFEEETGPQDGEGKGEVEDLLHSLVYILFCPTQENNSTEGSTRSNI
jgi:hypothetical protein